MAIIPDTLGAALAYLNQSLAGAGALKGEKGDPGPKGDPGEKGETGETGQTGASAYEVALANGFEGSEEDWLKSLTPTNIVTVSNSPFESHEGNFKINEISGKCEQFSTTGAQLFDGMLEVGSLNPDGTNNTTADAVRSVNYIAVTGGSTITLSNDKGYANYIYEYDEDKQLITYTANATTATLVLNDNTNFIRLRSVTSKVENDLSVKYMLNAGATALPWEPYTGGMPAPNPDYPQEIKKTVVSEIKTHGKNILNTDNVIVYSDTCKKFVIDVSAGTYVFSCSDVLNTQVRVEYYDGTTENIIPWSYASIKAFVAPKRIVGVMVNTEVTIDFDTYKYQLEAGSVATDYEPYIESTIKLSTPVELYGIGDVQDTIDVENGKIVRNYGIATENNLFLASGGSVSAGGLRWFDCNTNSLEAGNGCCTHLIKPVYAWASTVPCYAVSRGYVRIYDAANTNEEFKAKYAGLEFIYQRSEPVIEPLPITDQVALNSLKTYNNLTYVEFDSEVEPTFSGETALTTEGSHILEGLAKSNALTLEYLDAATYICDNLP